MECGIEAINHGADAVYIGAPRFSARAAASNTIEDIELLAKYAHKYYAKVYVALNTILDDRELDDAEKIIRQLYEAGADALIIQDMGITQLNLPPIPLHASTQTDNRTLEKVQFLEQAGFDQIVLARELSIGQIQEIANQTSVRLEAFIHGALCVSYSGQCYMSHALCNRSANRGLCAQLCRLPYTLTDASGKTIITDKHLLSLKDLNLSEYLKELIEAGISSFKIEGRLKDISYVKNITAFYRQKIDRILTNSDTHKKASSGKSVYTFEPNPEKSFHRGSTDYFLHGRNKNISSFDSPKSMGEYIGTVKSYSSSYFTVESHMKLANGDGLCYMDPQGSFSGFRVNKAEEDKVFPAEQISIPKGSKLYRNYDHAFEKKLSKKSAERKIAATICLSEEDDCLLFTIRDENNISTTLRKRHEKEIAQDKEKAKGFISKQLSKTGSRIFAIGSVKIDTENIYFIPSSLLTEWKNELINLLEAERENKRVRTTIQFPATTHPYPIKELDYRANIHNRKAKDFYTSHHVETAEDSFEKQKRSDAVLMFCKHCIKYSVGLCPKEKWNNQPYREPFFLTNSNRDKFRLYFDCKGCEMRVFLGDKICQSKFKA